jgi:hypothetical protein
MTLGRMFLTLLLVLVAGECIYAAVSLGWNGDDHSSWRLLFLPAFGLLGAAWFAWPR